MLAKLNVNIESRYALPALILAGEILTDFRKPGDAG